MSAVKDFDYDVVIIGSGPVGSAFARQLSESDPDASILMVELGPVIATPPGSNLLNLPDLQERAIAQRRSEGTPIAEGEVIVPRTDAPGSSKPGDTYRSRPGTELVTNGTGPVPAASIATNVGGMGSLWTCASPPPWGSERIPFLSESSWTPAFARARELLEVSTSVFGDTGRQSWAGRALGGLFDAERPEDRRVQNLPIAARRSASGGVHWSGSDTVLGPAAVSPRFRLVAETLCRELVVDGDRITHAVLEDRRSRQQTSVSAKVFVVAADSLRTPQLLWASNIRPWALGRYFNDHMRALLSASPQTTQHAEAVRSAGRAEATVGMLWVPFFDETHPFHGTVVLLAGGGAASASDPEVVSLSWFGRKELQASDRVRFADGMPDRYGMPAIEFEYSFTERDRAEAQRMVDTLDAAAAALGGAVRGERPRMIAAGSSSHYQGTFRMGSLDDGHSVTDPHSRVWGLRNLFLGGNGIIPTETAANPTATSVALAVLAAAEIHRLLGAESSQR